MLLGIVNHVVNGIAGQRFPPASIPHRLASCWKNAR